MFKDDNICSICLDILTNTNIITTNCNHSFHTECLNLHKQYNDNCPLCRRKIIKDKKKHVSDRFHIYEDPYILYWFSIIMTTYLIIHYL